MKNTHFNFWVELSVRSKSEQLLITEDFCLWQFNSSRPLFCCWGNVQTTFGYKNSNITKVQSLYGVTFEFELTISDIKMWYYFESFGIQKNRKLTQIFKFLNQCFARLRCWKKCLEFTKPTCWIFSCFAGDTFLRPKSCKTLI